MDMCESVFIDYPIGEKRNQECAEIVRKGVERVQSERDNDRKKNGITHWRDIMASTDYDWFAFNEDASAWHAAKQQEMEADEQGNDEDEV